MGHLSKTSGLVLAAGLLASCASKDIGYAVTETLGAPVSYLAGAAREIAKDPVQGFYNLPARAVSEAGRVVNGATHLATGQRYEAEFGGEKIHSLADNEAVRLGGWGAILAPVAFWSYLEGVFGGLFVGAGAEYFKKNKE